IGKRKTRDFEARERDARRSADDDGAASDSGANCANHVDERPVPRPRCAYRFVAMSTVDGLDREVAKGVERDRLRAIATVAKDRENWKPSQEIRDVVDQNVTGAKDDRRLEDRVLDARLADHALDPRLVAVVRQIRVLPRLAHADVDDLPDAGRARERD